MFTIQDLSDLANALASAHGKRPSGSGERYTTHCPAHEDTNGSLSLTLKGGKSLWHCHAGCDQNQVTAAIKRYLPKSSKNGAKPKIEVAWYDYCLPDESLSFQKVRYEPKEFVIRKSDGNGDWIYKQATRGLDTSILYKLPEVQKAIEAGQTIYIAEGEKDCNNLASLGFVTTCNFDGASQDGKKPKWTDENAKWLKGAKLVVIFADNDTAGKAHAQAIAKSLVKLGFACKIIELPGLSEKGDVSDWISQGGTAERLLKIIESAPLWKPRTEDNNEAHDKDPKTTPGQRDNAATLLLELIEQSGDSIEIFRVPSGEVFATVDGRTIPVDTAEFAGHLYKLYRAAYGGLCGKEAIGTVIAYLSGTVEKCRPVYVRLAHHEGKIYIDLANQDKQIVEISPGGWRVISTTSCPVKFWQPPGMTPLPVPAEGGDLSKLKNFMNLGPHDNNYRRVVMYLIACFVDGPLLVLEVVGEKGSAKTTQARILRMLIDPSECEVMVQPDSVRDLLLACRNQFLLVLDNINKLDTEQLDAHCCISTGASKRERRLYTNSEEAIYKFRRPQVFTAIKDVIRRNDLNDRKLKLKIGAITKAKRRSERAIFAELQPTLPALLGALYDTVAGALKELPGVKADNLDLPRMADAAELLIAAERFLHWPKGTILKLFADEAAIDAQDILESDPFAQALIAMLKAMNGSWSGTPSQVLKTLNGSESAPGNAIGWPKSTKGMNNRLCELAPDLREIGLTFEQEVGGDRRYTFRLAQQPGELSAASAQAPDSTQDDLFSHGGSAADGTNEESLDSPDNEAGGSMADTKIDLPGHLQAPF